jgi:DNA-binding response OmpR family regulator
MKMISRFVPAWGTESMETILVVEDDVSVQKVLRRLFEPAGYAIEVCGNGRSAMDAVKKGTPTAVILDLGLPGLSGKEVCREIRQKTTTLPVVVVSARMDELDKVVLLELGADDYVTKPFSPIELLARVRAAIRRAQKEGSLGAFHRVHFDEACVDFTKMEASVSGSPVHLTAHEFRILKFLVQSVDRAVNRTEILTEIFGYGSIHTRTMDNLILSLRQKLERDPANPAHILTVRGVGYRFAP